MRNITPRTLGIVAVAALVVGIAGCRDGRGPVGSKRDPMAPPAQVEEFLPAFLDEQERILPTLEDRRTAQELDDRLDRLVTFLRRRDAIRATEEVGLIRAALVYYGPSTNVRIADGAELGAIEILMDRAAVLLGMPALPNRAPADN